MKTIAELEIALRENDHNLMMERRVSRQVELLMVRMEIMKSLVHQYKLLVQEGRNTERKAA